jgi:hypothetical protein
MSITGIIYKITSPQTDKVYIGSTSNSIDKRFDQHKRGYTLYKSGKATYISSYEILKFDDAIIEVLEEGEFEDKKEMLMKERKHIEATSNNNVNKISPIKTKEEYKAFFKEYGKEYRKTNKESIKLYTKNYTVNNKDKRYKYAMDNKEKFSNHAKEVVNCECGSSITRRNKASHNKSKRHINYITIQNTINIKDSEVIINNGK